MSGIEVAGLVLGVLPILFQAVDIYKDGIRRSATAFRKRKYETVRSVVIASGCEDVLRLDEDPVGYLDDNLVQNQVLEYMGIKNISAFSGALKHSNCIVKKIAGSIIGLIPAFKGPTDDLLEIIKANREAPSRQLDLIPRVKLMFSVTELKDFIQELDETTNRLNRFVGIVLSNRQIVQDKSSLKAVKLAKALHQVRGFASNLYLALCQGWKADCHSRHEAKLFLEDRVDSVTNILEHSGRNTSVPILVFKMIFTAGISQKQISWDETAVQVYYDNTHQSIQPSFSSKVKIVAPQKVTPKKPEVTFVGDICGALETTRCDQRPVAFILTEKQQVGIAPTEKKIWIAHEQPDTTTSKNLLLSSIESHRRAPILPWKSRMFLALTLSSNLLQLLQTQWLESPWSKDMVHFLIKQQKTAIDGSYDKHIELGRPFVSLTFDATSPSYPKGQVEPKIALLELGILLLEIWYETTLETRFSKTEAPTRYYDRLALAEEWIDDTNNPLPDLYEKAVSHCIRRTVGGEFRILDWENMKFWGAICGDVIEPLSMICKQWNRNVPISDC